MSADVQSLATLVAPHLLTHSCMLGRLRGVAWFLVCHASCRYDGTGTQLSYPSLTVLT